MIRTKPFEVREMATGECRVLMSNGLWMVQAKPKLAPPPREMTPAEQLVDRSIDPCQGLGMWGPKRPGKQYLWSENG